MSLLFKQIFISFLFLNIITMYTFTVFDTGTEETEILGNEDAVNDLRNFNHKWFNDEIDIDDMFDGNVEKLNHIYKKIEKNYNNKEVTEPLYNKESDGESNIEGYKDYKDYSYIDLFNIELYKNDNSIKYLRINVMGDANSMEKPWYLFIWTGNTGNNIMITAECNITENGDEYDYNIKSGDGKTELKDGGIKFDKEDDSRLSMKLNDEIYTELKGNNYYIIFFSPVKIDETDVDYIVDIYPFGSNDLFTNIQFWIFILIFFVIVTFCIVLLYLWKTNKIKKIKR